MNYSGLTKFLLRHAAISPISFHMPGHKGSAIYEKYGYEDFMNSFVDCDITEIPGADNLFQMESVIKEVADKYVELYGVKASYPLINGTSGGLIAGVLASVKKGGKLIMARNCHKSVFNALMLGDISPVYAYPSMIEEYGISGAIKPEEIERCLEENPDAEAVILPSPNYYGICSDIEAIAEVVHRHNKVLIVDQAHGAHLKFFKNMPKAAEDCGADIIVNSTHKTLASFTQSAVLNLNSDRVPRHILEDKLQAIQSTSPSYILMASLDINADILLKNKDKIFDKWEENLNQFYNDAYEIPGVQFMHVPGEMDATKINLDMSRYGIDGSELEEILMEEGIFAELVTGNILMCMTGIGNVRSDYSRLVTVLEKIARERILLPEMKKEHDNTGPKLWSKKRELFKIGETKRQVALDECEGMICGASIIPYPPGIPFICPGEKIGREEIDYIKQLRAKGEKVIGVDDAMRVVVCE